MSPARRLGLGGVGLLGLTGLGTLGYRALEGWPWLDALYMTVITLSTVGFREVGPLSDAGRLFTIALIGVGVGGALYVVTALAEFLIAGSLRQLVQRSAMQRRIEELADHVIVCGYGRYGRVVVEELVHAGAPVAAIELDPAREAQLLSAGIPYLIGSAASEEVLLRAGLARARAVVVTTASDADNVFITLCARELAPQVRIHARGESEASVRRLRQAGADVVTSPYRMGGLRSAASILRPSVVDFIEISAPGRGEEVDLEEIRVGEGSALVGRDLGSLESEAPRLLVVAHRRGGAKLGLAPAKTLAVEPGDHLVVVGERAAVDRLAERARSRGGPG
jgi:voltage-gated potassium channel